MTGFRIALRARAAREGDTTYAERDDARAEKRSRDYRGVVHDDANAPLALVPPQPARQRARGQRARGINGEAEFLRHLARQGAVGPRGPLVLHNHPVAPVRTALLDPRPGQHADHKDRAPDPAHA